jgi:RimJ/RimL family protein N-acetyltransferase
VPRAGSAPRHAALELVPVDDEVLERLVTVAVTDASAREVTPPVTAGEQWSPERVDWLRAFHRARRAGLAGPHQEATWAVRVDGAVVGSVRLRRTVDAGVLETGIWLTRSARGRGTGARALAAVIATARPLGHELRAETTGGNRPALTVLAAAGFTLDPPDGAGAVVARLRLREQTAAGRS